MVPGGPEGEDFAWPEERVPLPPNRVTAAGLAQILPGIARGEKHPAEPGLDGRVRSLFGHSLHYWRARAEDAVLSVLAVDNGARR